MIGTEFIGRTWAPHRVEVEKGRLRFFAKAIGESDPVYTDEEAARRAGYSSLPVPPTFLFSLEMEQPDPFRYLSEMGVPLAKVLHGEQSFRYHRVAVAGEVLTFRPRVSDIYSKKGGALEFIVKDTQVEDESGAPVAELRSVIVVRHG